ncbi:uncharacterized protein BBA_02544 [Beauveria bassiana ARSEF 2860]|uniref:Monooxygenase n=1 Tax=Beauveria bassiana (strain ARSEF 2860) TaxID=655819 RepID=J4USB6_BEAB2|nr:uncharacterized protein BBA_02544 [Beauveria bassiana ARSEF 2860]EJP68542.1 hypothetical protein BBA_02544 [Beauveria bassiana ARSEF 2860]
MGKGFQPKLAPTERPWTYTPPPSARYGLDKILRLPVFLVLGSLAQCLLSLVLPPRWAVVPLLCYLAISLVSLLLNTTTTTSTSTSTALPRNVVPGRAAAQLPLPDGSFRASPAEDSLVVFHIGAQFNHPLGPLCPGGGATAERFDKLIADLRARAAELGVLAVSGWQGVVDGSFSTKTTIYFEDVASLHGFAHEPMHREAWDWFAAQRFPHLGVYHETFVVPRRSYECVYLNCKPLLLGQAARLARGGGEKGEADKRWVNALVNADTPALKTQYARMGRDRNGQVVEG